MPWQLLCKCRAGLAGARQLGFTRLTKENQDGKSKFSLLGEMGILFSDFVQQQAHSENAPV